MKIIMIRKICPIDKNNCSICDKDLIDASYKTFKLKNNLIKFCCLNCVDIIKEEQFIYIDNRNGKVFYSDVK